MGQGMGTWTSRAWLPGRQGPSALSTGASLVLLSGSAHFLLFWGPGEVLKHIPRSYWQTLPGVPLALGTRGAWFQVSDGPSLLGKTHQHH